MEILKNLNNLLWGIPLPVLLFRSHLYYTFKLKGVQKHIGKAIRISFRPDQEGEGDLSGFAALSATLAATIGTGNIVGISTAIALGGPGAILWCWLTGILGMATTYAECYLGIKYRRKTSTGPTSAGLCMLEKGLNQKWLAVISVYLP
jgi:AGCS family alanine or glycine:cation symporter